MKSIVVPARHPIGRKIIENHKGIIFSTAEEDIGTAFILYFLCGFFIFNKYILVIKSYHKFKNKKPAIYITCKGGLFIKCNFPLV